MTTAPRTFWADRWRFARERTGQRLRPALRSFWIRSIAPTLAFTFGVFFFGARWLFAELEGYAIGIMATAATLVFALLAGIAVFAFHFMTAPAAMWRRDQETIAQLQSLLTPSVRLEFSEEDCRAWLRVGDVHPSVGGKRWIRSEGTPEHVLIRCVNSSEVRINGIEAYAALLRFTPPGEDAMAPPGFLDPVRIKSPFDEADTISLPAHGTRHLSVLVRSSGYDPPRLNSAALTLAYERQFEKPGTYEIGIEAHGPNIPAAEATLIMEIQTELFPDAMGRKHPRYDIVSVRRKTD